MAKAAAPKPPARKSVAKAAAAKAVPATSKAVAAKKATPGRPHRRPRRRARRPRRRPRRRPPRGEGGSKRHRRRRRPRSRRRRPRRPPRRRRRRPRRRRREDPGEGAGQAGRPGEDSRGDRGQGRAGQGRAGQEAGPQADHRDLPPVGLRGQAREAGPLAQDPRAPPGQPDRGAGPPRAAGRRSSQAEADQLAAEREGGDTQFDEESGEGDTINIERERDLLLSASAQQIVDEIDRALERIADGHLRAVPPRRPSHQPRAPRSPAVRRDLRRLQGSCRATPLAVTPATPAARRAPNASAEPAPTGRPLLATAIVLGVVVLDQLTSGGRSASCRGDPVDVIGDDIGFALVRNTGSAFSLFQAFTPFLAVVAIVVAIILVRTVRRTRDTLMVVGLSLVLGGALGNLHRPPVPDARVPEGCGRRLRPRRRLPDVQRGRLRDHDRRDPDRRLGDPRRRPRTATPPSDRVPVAEPLAVPEALGGGAARPRGGPAHRLDPHARCRTWSRRARCWSTAAACPRAASSRPASVIELLAEPEVAGLPAARPVDRGGRAPRGRRRVVVAKPAGLVVHPGAGHPDGTLVNGLLARYPEIAGVGDPARPGDRAPPRPRHQRAARRGALDRAAYEGLVEMLAAHDVERRYDALVWGVPDSPAGCDRRARSAGRCADPRACPSARAGARPAPSTRSSPPIREPEVARLECRLETGRTHQIRVHLQAIGHPVVGDAAYGGQRPAHRARPPVPPRRGARLRPPGHRRPARGGGAARARAGRGARPLSPPELDLSS